MVFAELLLIAIGLSMDAFAVCVTAATAGFASNPRARFRLAFHFGLFQALMPIIGWGFGLSIAHLIARFDHWVAFGLLAFVGVRMIRSGLSGKEEEHKDDPSRGLNLVILSVATSIDALAIGLSLAAIRISIWYPAVVIGVTTASLSLVGLYLGGKLSHRLGPRMEVVGGFILIFIGVRVLAEHLYGL